jgi:hypothetical protein
MVARSKYGILVKCGIKAKTASYSKAEALVSYGIHYSAYVQMFK